MEWIKCSDGMPEDFQKVAWLYHERIIDNDYYNPATGDYKSRSTCSVGIGFYESVGRFEKRHYGEEATIWADYVCYWIPLEILNLPEYKEHNETCKADRI